MGIWNYLTSDYVWDIVAREGIFLPGTRIRAWSWSSSPTHRFPTCFILNMINHYSILYIICTLLYVYDIYTHIHFHLFHIHCLSKNSFAYTTVHPSPFTAHFVLRSALRALRGLLWHAHLPELLGQGPPGGQVGRGDLWCSAMWMENMAISWGFLKFGYLDIVKINKDQLYNKNSKD